MDDTGPGLSTLLKRGLKRRCPVCGKGALFRRFARLRQTCPACGWVLERDPGAMTGSMYLMSVVSQFFAVGLWLLLWWLTDWSTGFMVAIALPVIAVFSLAALPFTQGLWVAVEYYTDLASGDSKQPEYRDRAYRNSTD